MSAFGGKAAPPQSGVLRSPLLHAQTSNKPGTPRQIVNNAAVTAGIKAARPAYQHAAVVAVAHHVRDVGVAGSNPATPTNT